MKAQKLIGLIAFACAFVSLSAFANKTNDWFSACATNYVPYLTHVTTNPVCEVKGQNFYVFNSSANRLVFTPDTTASLTNRSDDVYTIEVKAHFTACWVNDFPTVDNDVKLALTAGYDNEDGSGYTNLFYKIGSGNWTKLFQSPSYSASSSFSGQARDTFYITFDLREGNGTVKVDWEKAGKNFKTLLGETPLPNLENIKTVEAFGVGRLADLYARYEVAVAATNSTGATKYGSYKEAFDLVGQNTNKFYIVYFPGGNEERHLATERSPNGLTFWENAVIGLQPDEQLKVYRADKQNANRVTLRVSDTYESDLAAAYYNIKYKVWSQRGFRYYPETGSSSADAVDPGLSYYDPDDIRLPYKASEIANGEYIFELVPLIFRK